MTYSDVKELEEGPLNYENGYRFEEDSYASRKDGRILHQNSDDLGDCLYVRWKGLRGRKQHAVDYVFYVDKNTSQVIDFGRDWI